MLRFTYISTRERLSDLSLPAENESYRVEDVCRLGDQAVLAHGQGRHEIAIVRPALDVSKT